MNGTKNSLPVKNILLDQKLKKWQKNFQMLNFLEHLKDGLINFTADTI